MKKFDFKLVLITIMFIVVLVASFSFKKKLDNLNANYQSMSNYIHGFRLDYNVHLNTVKESIINLHFNNDSFVENTKLSKQGQSIFYAQEHLRKNYSLVYDSYKSYIKNTQQLKNDTLQFMKLNASVKNSLTILNKNLNKYLSSYDKEYLSKLINIINEFKNIKDDIKSNENISLALVEYFEKNKGPESIKDLNYIHIKLLYTNIPQFKDYFKSISSSKVLIDIKNMREALAKDSKVLEDELSTELYIMLVCYVLFFVIILKLILNIKNDSKKILKLKKANEKSYKTDSLTLLSNRYAFQDDMKRLTNSSVLFLDIIDFNSINAIAGYDGANSVLKQLAIFLKGYIKKNNSLYKNIYRVGIDQYALISKSTNKDELNTLATNIINEIEKTIFSVGDLKLQVYIQAGISTKRPYLENAEIAIKETKNSFNKVSFFEDSMQEDKENIKSNIQMLSKLEDAINNDNIRPFFQKIVDLKTKEVVKYEALVRLIDEDKAISPYFFLELSKKSKHYTKITQIVINKSIQFIRKTNNHVSINLSYQDITDPYTVSFLEKTLEENKDIASKITFELLESDDIDNYKELLEFIDFIKSYGCLLAIDDFGSGYSNFTHLFNMKPDIVKIDGSLIKNIDTDETSKNIVVSLVSLTNKSGIKTVAEFIDNERVDSFVTGLNIDYGQGYYYAPPKDLL